MDNPSFLPDIASDMSVSIRHANYRSGPEPCQGKAIDSMGGLR
jgi:hypothetical protein